MEQNYKNHIRLDPVHHYVTGGLLLITTIGAVRNVFQSFDNEDRLYNASLIAAIVLILWFIWLYARGFALRAQDRVIMLEERIRHKELTGKPLSNNLCTSQVVALRFASDEEFPALAVKAERENLENKAIKQLIVHWRADHCRV